MGLRRAQGRFEFFDKTLNGIVPNRNVGRHINVSLLLMRNEPHVQGLAPPRKRPEETLSETAFLPLKPQRQDFGRDVLKDGFLKKREAVCAHDDRLVCNVEGHVKGRRGMGEPADGDAVHAGAGDGPDVLEGHPTRNFEQWPSG